MKLRQRQVKPLYPYEEWSITEDSFDVETNYRDETIFALGNGYIGMRGNFEEGYQGPQGSSLQGIYLNGFYESEPIHYGEAAYGYARTSQTMLNVTNSQVIYLVIGKERFDLFSGKVLSYKRTLDMKRGLLTRSLIWESPSGQRVEVDIRRMLSLQRKHVAAISYQVRAINFAGELSLESLLDGQVHNQVTLGDPRVGSSFHGQVLVTEDVQQQGSYAALWQRTQNTQFALVCAMKNEFIGSDSFTTERMRIHEGVGLRYRGKIRPGETVILNKYIAYVTSKDYPEEQLWQTARQEVEQAKILGFDHLQQEQNKFLEKYWEIADVVIEGDLALQQSLRFNAFHLLQSVGRDGKTNIAAKGVTGEGYEGHYFWDTETYIFPFFLYTHPWIAKSLLQYRYYTLDKARDRAREMSQKGALYAWRTIDGEETSAYYPAGTAAYHIDADIVHALKTYMQATQDMEFFLRAGAEMLFETARLWADLGDHIPGKGFCINEVTGPDEYTALVNNNLYTNVMAKDHLEYACTMAKRLQQEYPQEYARLTDKIGLQDEEIQAWQKAAEEMFIPFAKELGIYPQDDTFLSKAVWDFAHTPADHYPLLLHYHPLVIYRHQVLKQADVVLALLLQAERFSLAEKKRNYDYYEAITTHDSSLSPCIHSIIGAEIGYLDKAYAYFMQTARMDLDDYNGNVKDGIHTASMAGAWLSVVQGFAGLRDINGQLQFNPVLPRQWQGYHFKVVYQGCLLAVSVYREKAIYHLERGPALDIVHHRSILHLEPLCPQEVSLTPKLEAVIFDLDGVITDTAEYHYRAWQKLANEVGLSFDRAVNERLKGISRMDSLEVILEHSQRQFTPEEKLQLAQRKNEYYLQFVLEMTPQDLLPGAAQLLKALKREGILIALASASKNAPTVLDKLGLADWFDAVVDPAKLQKGKPDPEIFMRAADLLRVPVTHCVGVEDAEAGIEAIHAANMWAVGVATPGAMAKADWPVESLVEVTVQQLRQWMEGGPGL